VDQDTLAHLYRAAAAFVLPTQAEGFSFTILEALASGAPVVTLRHDALVEAGLDRAVLALPGPEPAALAEALVEVLTRPATAERLRADGVAATRDFSWAHNARATMDVIRAVIENRAS
jgi:glycosyltransferase involved in cell wall biosynthesis